MLFGPKIRSIAVTELDEQLRTPGTMLLDVREPYEYAAGHVPGARNIPLGTLPKAAEGLGKDSHVLVICQSGSRSVAATKRLMAAGFTDVTNVSGGTGAYRGKLKR